jgi:hypothetical protein
MADLYLKNLESERKALWATCRLKGLARNTPERQRIAAIDEAIAAHKGKGRGRLFVAGVSNEAPAELCFGEGDPERD